MSDNLSPTSNVSQSESRVRIESLRVHRDPRGLIFEPMAAQEMAGFRNVHVVITEPGAVRGNHRHIKGTEVATVVGPMTVCYREAGQLQTVEMAAGEIKRFWFPPGVAHAFRNHGEVPSVLTAFNTEEHNPDVPDAVREVLIE